jgi:hypothetical protein
LRGLSKGRVRVRVIREARESDNVRAGATPALLGLVGGLIVGYTAWALQQQRHQRALFHTRPFRRLAALGYLRAHPSVDSARLLREYLQWEPHPLLRRRARQVLRRMEHQLRS